MIYLAYSILIICGIIGLFAVLFTGGGTLVIFLGALIFALITKFTAINFGTLAFLLALYVFGEILEHVAVMLGAKKLGASGAAIVGAILGGIFGALAGTAFFGVGIIPATFAGIFLGAFLLELLVRRNLKQSLKAGLGGILGRVGAIASSLVIAFCMYAVIIFTIVTAN